MISIYPTLSYEDAPAAIDFLCEAFGFERLQVMTGEGDDREVVHAELRLGDGIVMVGGRRRDDLATSGTQLVYVALDDLDEHHARAAKAGAQIIREPFDTDYGSRDYQARDPEGNVWAFGTYRPEAAKTS
jgi:uncharacterized glyoxalase superfamily protein PhnB